MTNKLVSLLADLERNIIFFDKQQATVSSSTIGWHVEHCLLTLDKIIDRLSTTNSLDYKWKLNLIKLFVFTTGTIPRGRGESPKIVRPTGEITNESLMKHLQQTKEKLKELAQMKPEQYFEHPYFGHLKLKQTIKFLEIHTKHHLKIIEEINAQK